MESAALHVRFADIAVSRASETGITTIFRIDAGQNAERRSLVIAVDIPSSLYAYERLVEAIKTAAERAQQRADASEQDALTRFEALLQRVNGAASKAGAEAGAALDWSQVHIAMAEISAGHICLTAIGSPCAIFFQKQGDGLWKGFDFLQSLERPTDIDPTKPFASLLCGDLHAGDVVLLGNRALETWRGEARIKERLTTLPLATAAMDIGNDLKSIAPADQAFAAVVAGAELRRRNSPTDTPKPRAATMPAHEPTTKTPEPVRVPNAAPTAPPAQTVAPPVQAAASMEQLRQSERRADEHLGPRSGTMSDARRTVMAVGARIGNIMDDLRAKVMRKATGPRVGQQAPPSRPLRDATTLAGLRQMNAGVGRGLDRRLLLGIGLVLILAGTAGHAYWKQRRATAAELAAWSASADRVTDLHDQAERDLTYGNETRARTEVADAERDLATLDRSTPERAQRAEALAQSLAALKERLRKARTADAAELFALPPGAPDGSLSAPLLVGDQAFVANADGKSVVRIDVNDRNATSISLGAEAGPVVAAISGNGRTLFITQDGKAFSLTNGANEAKEVSWSGAPTSTRDAVIYGGRLYALDPANSQIWRYNAAGTGFSGKAAYIKAAGTQLGDASALAIDSSVYALKNDGTLVRFLSGAQEGFGLGDVTPALRAASGLWTDVDMPAIIVADPADKRILIYGKDGQLAAQLSAPQFTAPKDLSVDYAAKRALVVDGNRLLLVPLP